MHACTSILLDYEHTDECSPEDEDDCTNPVELDHSCEDDDLGDDDIEAPPFSPISSAGESTDSEPETESNSRSELVGICGCIIIAEILQLYNYYINRRVLK